jgi:hypothetical protein
MTKLLINSYFTATGTPLCPNNCTVYICSNLGSKHETLTHKESHCADMSEYWKSTVRNRSRFSQLSLTLHEQPKYWCKHCSTFVRDTKLEKANHEATPKHQGNLKRFLRDLHRGHEKDQKDKERAKAEVARLNGVVSGEGSSSRAGSSSVQTTAYTKAPVPRAQATPAQRKQQLAQLAEMGVAIPDEFRPDMAMAGEWQVMSEKVVEDESDKNPEAIALGVRKRPADEDEEEKQDLKKKRWGSSYKTHPGEDDVDLDALLNNASRKEKTPKAEAEPEVVAQIKQEIKQEEVAEQEDAEDIKKSASDDLTDTMVKREPGEASGGVGAVNFNSMEPDQSAPSDVVFKKRKTKNIRQK